MMLSRCTQQGGTRGSGGPSGQTPDRNTGRGPPEQNRQTDREGPWRSWELRRPWRSWALRRPWQIVFGACLGPLGPAPTAGTLLPPQKISLGKVRGYSGALQGLDTQKQDMIALQAKQTGQDSHQGLNRQEQEAHRNRKPSWAKFGSWGFFWACTWHQGPSQGFPQATASTFTTGGQAA